MACSWVVAAAGRAATVTTDPAQGGQHGHRREGGATRPTVDPAVGAVPAPAGGR